VARRLALVLAFAGAVAFAASAAAATPFRLTSPAFTAGKPIPRVYTCKGRGISPPLRWTAPPAGTQSLAIEIEDPDAPLPGGFTHWLGWGIRPAARALATGAHAPTEGANGTGKPGYIGPCPPSGTHHYHITLYALNAPLMLMTGAKRAAFTRALRGHVLARATLIGTVAAG
jgi:Raf kinase inhibitor-like YbhB/YbcL family protein